MIKLSEKKVRSEIKKYFHISEMVGTATLNKYGESAWKFLDYRLLYTILVIREGLNKEMYINHAGKKQRGLRTIVQQIVKSYFIKRKLYISAHLLGKAVDFDVDGMDAEEVRQWIKLNSHLFPFKIRIESGVSWVHLDVIWEDKNPKVYEFLP